MTFNRFFAQSVSIISLAKAQYFQKEIIHLPAQLILSNS